MHNNGMIRLGTEEEKRWLLREYPNTQHVIGDGGYLVIAQKEGAVVGFLWAFKRKIPAPIERDELFINVIEVIDPSLRRQGLASAMVREAVRLASEEGVYQLRAYCDIQNVPSHRLWLKNKFSISPVKMPDGSIAGSFVSLVL